MVGRLLTELKQTRPFRSREDEAFLNLVRTTELLRREVIELFKPHDLTHAQYNVLRILRGAGDAGMPTLAIRDRMVEEAAGITRLLDKLEAAGYVVRERSTPDRRQVLCHITPKGVGVIAALDAPMDAANKRAGSMLEDAERGQLIELLGAIRAAYANGRGRADPAPRRNALGQGSARAGQPPM